MVELLLLASAFMSACIRSGSYHSLPYCNADSEEEEEEEEGGSCELSISQMKMFTERKRKRDFDAYLIANEFPSVTIPNLLKFTDSRTNDV